MNLHNDLEYPFSHRCLAPAICSNAYCTSHELVRVPGEFCRGCRDQQEKERQRLRLAKRA